MSKKQKETVAGVEGVQGEETVEGAEGEETVKSIKREPVLLTVRREHCLEPHSVELRKNDEGIVIDARTEDFKHTETIGAKLVAHLLAESGVSIPDDDETELIISFSPANGEVIAIIPLSN